MSKLNDMINEDLETASILNTMAKNEGYPVPNVGESVHLCLIGPRYEYIWRSVIILQKHEHDLFTVRYKQLTYQIKLERCNFPHFWHF